MKGRCCCQDTAWTSLLPADRMNEDGLTFAIVSRIWCDRDREAGGVIWKNYTHVYVIPTVHLTTIQR